MCGAATLNFLCTQGWRNSLPQVAGKDFVTVPVFEARSSNSSLQRDRDRYAALSPDQRKKKNQADTERQRRLRDELREEGRGSKYAGEQMSCPACTTTFSRSNFKSYFQRHLRTSANCYELVQSRGPSKLQAYLPSRSDSK